eukprot:6208678-Pyramimonas_sp.AAC.1
MSNAVGTPSSVATALRTGAAVSVRIQRPTLRGGVVLRSRPARKAASPRLLCVSRPGPPLNP